MLAKRSVLAVAVTLAAYIVPSTANSVCSPGEIGIISDAYNRIHISSNNCYSFSDGTAPCGTFPTAEVSCSGNIVNGIHLDPTVSDGPTANLQFNTCRQVFDPPDDPCPRGSPIGTFVKVLFCCGP